MKLINSAILFSFLLVSFFLVSCDSSDSVTPHEDHFEAAGYVLLNSNNDIVFKVLNGKVDQSIAADFKLKLSDGPVKYNIKFLDTDGLDLGVPDDVNKSLLVEFSNNEFATAVIDKWEFTLVPLALGTTTIRVQILHEGHPDFTAPYVNLEIL